MVTAFRGARVHGQLEDVGAVVVADSVEQPPPGRHGGEVDLRRQDASSWRSGPGDDLAVRVADHAVARLDPLRLVTVEGSPDPVAVGEVGGIWSTRTQGFTPITHTRPSRAMWRIVAIQPSPLARVGATQISTPWAYRWNRARGM